MMIIILMQFFRTDVYEKCNQRKASLPFPKVRLKTIIDSVYFL